MNREPPTRRRNVREQPRECASSRRRWARQDSNLRPTDYELSESVGTPIVLALECGLSLADIRLYLLISRQSSRQSFPRGQISAISRPLRGPRRGVEESCRILQPPSMLRL